MKNRRSQGVRTYRYFADIASTSAAGSNQFNCVLFDLKGTLELYTTAGQELRITKATIKTMTKNNTYSHGYSVVAVVSDADIAAAAPAAAAYDILDSQVDAVTAGEFESQLLASSNISKEDNGTTLVYNANAKADFTNFAQRFASLLSRSALLSSNPYGKIIATGFSSSTNQTPVFTVFVELQYSLIAKPLRMLS